MNGCQEHWPTTPRPPPPPPPRLDSSVVRMQGSNLQTAARVNACEEISVRVEKKNPLASFTSLSSVHPSDLLKPCLTETTLQVFRLRGDHGVTEETKNPQDVECMFGTAPASQEDIKDDGSAAIGLSTFSSPSHHPRPDRSCRGSSSGLVETKEKSPAAAVWVFNSF